MGLPARPPAPRSAEPFSFPIPEVVELGGGLLALLLEDHHLPLVQLQVVLRAGLSSEPPEALGAAYACACMVDEGAGARSTLQLAAALQAIGAGLSLWTGYDSSNISLQVLRPHLGRALDLMCDVLLRPRFEVNEWRRVAKEVQGRSLQRRSEPSESAALGLSRLVFGDHPYARPLLPLIDEVRKLQLADVRRFYGANYRRDQAIVVAAGDLTAAVLKRELGRRLSSWQSRPAAGTPKLARLPRARGRRLGIIDRPGASQSVLRVGHACPPRSQLDWAGVKLLNTVLGGSFTSRLNLNLRERHGYTYGVSSSFHLTRGPTLFTVGTSVATENTADAIAEILGEIEELRQTKVSQAELDKARQLVIESLPAQAETLEDLTEEYGALAVHELPLDAVARLPEQCAAVEPADLQRLAGALLHPEHAVMVVVGDAARLTDELSGLVEEIVPLDEDGRRLTARKPVGHRHRADQ